MEPTDILTQAATIARDARKTVELAQLEETVHELETSDVPVLRSLARTYRMLQRPFF